MCWLTGGAGYIGSHVVLALCEAGHSVHVLDDLSTGRREATPDNVMLVEGDVGDGRLTATLIERHRIQAVMHFAGSIVVPESVGRPLDYYGNNTCASRNLLVSCVAQGVRHFVFSSTAAVYGSPARVPLTEDTPTAPINPHGTSKLMTEWMLRDAAEAHGLSYAALRYFNVAAADPRGRCWAIDALCYTSDQGHLRARRWAAALMSSCSATIMTRPTGLASATIFTSPISRTRTSRRWNTLPRGAATSCSIAAMAAATRCARSWQAFSGGRQRLSR